MVLLVIPALATDDLPNLCWRISQNSLINRKRTQHMKWQDHLGDESLRHDSPINNRLKRIENLKAELKRSHSISDEMELLRTLSIEITELRELRSNRFSEPCS
jgi:hypothetical protein